MILFVVFVGAVWVSALERVAEGWAGQGQDARPVVSTAQEELDHTLARPTPRFTR